MARIFLLLLLVAAVLGMAGCASDPGSREFIPGQGWVPVQQN